MPFIVCDARKVVLNADAFQQLTKIFRKRKNNLDNISYHEVYQLTGSDFGEAKNTLIVLIRVNGGPLRFTHLHGRDLQDMLDAFHPELYETEHRVRLDQECRIDDFRGVAYTRY
jgi:hypothetical protein